MNNLAPPEPFVGGVETEFGIHWQDLKSAEGDQYTADPLYAANFFVSYLQAYMATNSPFRFSRKVSLWSIGTPNVTWPLDNGAKIHVDAGHPEYATGECDDPFFVALHSKAGEWFFELVLRDLNNKIAAMRKEDIREAVFKNNILNFNPVTPPPPDPIGPISLQKNNADPSGNCYGAHANYL